MGYNMLSQKEIGRYLRYYRMKAGLTARQAAEQLGFATQQSIFNIESGKTTIKSERLYAYLKMCCVPRDEAFKEPLSVVNDPSRAKRHGSMRSQEMAEIYQQLDDKRQHILLSIARWSLADQLNKTEEDAEE